MNDKIVRGCCSCLSSQRPFWVQEFSLCWAPDSEPAARRHPEVTVHGRKFTPRSTWRENMGTPEDQAAQFPPTKLSATSTMWDENPELISHCHIARQYLI